MPFLPLFLDETPKIAPTFEVRERFERRIDRDFKSATNDNRSDIFSRVRAGVRINLDGSTQAVVRYQFAHDLGWTAPLNNSTTDSAIDLAYVETKQKDLKVTVGRQKIIVGQERLIGPAEWLNIPRSFDAIRADSGAYNLWVSKVQIGVAKSTDILLAGATRTDARFGDQSIIQKHDKVGPQAIDITTVDELWTGGIHGFKIEFEGAGQLGRNLGRAQQAWALHGRMSHSLGSRFQGFVEANSASGGNDKEVVKTFDNLYPSNHSFYGTMDMQGWRNMNELAIGVSFEATKSLNLRVSEHSFALQNPFDAWYGASGAANSFKGGAYRDPTGQSGVDIGRELDLDLTWSINKQSSVQAGIGFFSPGHFVEATRGSSDHQTWGFLILNFKL